MPVNAGTTLLGGVALARAAAGGLMALVVGLVLVLAGGACYKAQTGEASVGDAVKFKLPALPGSGANTVEVFTEMHFQPSYRSQESPRLLPPDGSVPVSGRELAYASTAEYRGLPVPEKVRQTYDPARGLRLYQVNCVMCHGPTLQGDGPVRALMAKGPFPADLTLPVTVNATDGELFGFVGDGGRQGQALLLRGLASLSPMPPFRLLLTEEERWMVVMYLRSLQPAGGGQ